MAAKTAEKTPLQTFHKLAALEEKLAGQPSYDYLLGISAIRAGQNAHAIMALERVVLTTPDHAEAKLALASAYMNSGDLDRLKEMLSAIDPSLLSPTARSTWEQLMQQLTLLTALKNQKNHVKSWRGTLRLSGGYDDNITGGVEEEILTPLWWLAEKDKQPLRQHEDLFSQVRGTLQYRHTLGSGFTAMANGSVDLSFPTGEPQERQARLKMGGALSWRKGMDRLVTNLSWRSTYQHEEKPYYQPSALLQWQHVWNRQRLSALFGQFTATLYPYDHTQDSYQWLAGGQHRESLSWPKPKSRLSVGGHVGILRPKSVSQIGSRHHMAGLSLSGEIPVKKDLWLFVRHSLERRNYEADSSGDVRHDTRMDVSGGLLWRLDKSRDVTLRLDRNRNRSTENTENTTRHVLGLSMQWRF
ncbi:tetratricopeptide repeat protein [Magnetococcus sp. PR-3]|uniref:tetratricopeptide repeat protein n=1 Tax=Magnetococcus sp. PR-3 TaxID=3120355 RepID=UPI002FCDEC4F